MGGRGRFFDHGDLKLVILALVAEKPSHGYEIIKAIEERVAGAYTPSPGVVYPTLTMLEELGHVTVETIAGNRKQYQITEEGRGFLAANAAEVKVIFARMAEAGEHIHGGRNPQLVRAMENLRLALRLRFASGSLSAEQVATITAALDEAAGKIERS
jgi:DNA-binding PadR family transcriptional regulator